MNRREKEKGRKKGHKRQMFDGKALQLLMAGRDARTFFGNRRNEVLVGRVWSHFTVKYLEGLTCSWEWSDVSLLNSCRSACVLQDQNQMFVGAKRVATEIVFHLKQHSSEKLNKTIRSLQCCRVREALQLLPLFILFLPDNYCSPSDCKALKFPW